MGRSPCCEKAHTNKGAWTKEEDDRLIAHIQAHGEGCWRSLPKAAGLLRCGKSCRLRWINYLRPDLKRGNFTDEEDELIIKLHSLLGNKYVSITLDSLFITQLPLMEVFPCSSAVKVVSYSRKITGENWQRDQKLLEHPYKEEATEQRDWPLDASTHQWGSCGRSHRLFWWSPEEGRGDE